MLTLNKADGSNIGVDIPLSDIGSVLNAHNLIYRPSIFNKTYSFEIDVSERGVECVYGTGTTLGQNSYVKGTYGNAMVHLENGASSYSWGSTISSKYITDEYDFSYTSMDEIFFEEYSVMGGAFTEPGDYSIPIDGFESSAHDKTYRRAEFAYDYGNNNVECLDFTIQDNGYLIFHEKTIEFNPNHFIGSKSVDGTGTSQIHYIISTDRILL